MRAGAADLYARAERLREECAKSSEHLGGPSKTFRSMDCSGTFY
jgi:hypothetical protein